MAPMGWNEKCGITHAIVSVYARVAEWLNATRPEAGK